MLNKASTVPNFYGALIFLHFSDVEPTIIFKLLLYLDENIPIFVDVSLYFKAGHSSKSWHFWIDFRFSAFS